MLCCRCDESTSDVNLERCLEEYLEFVIGCSSPYSFSTDTKYKTCNASEHRKYLQEYQDISEAGETEINRITKCLPRFNLTLFVKDYM